MIAWTKVRFFWRGYRKVEYATRDNAHFAAQLAGIGVSSLARYLPAPVTEIILRPAAQTVKLAQRTHEAVMQTQRVFQSLQSFRDAHIEEIEEPPIRILLTRPFYERFCYPATLQEKQFLLNCFFERVARVFHHAIALLRHTFILSMRLADVKEALIQQEEDIEDIAVNLISLPEIIAQLNALAPYTQWVITHVTAPNPLFARIFQEHSAP